MNCHTLNSAQNLTIVMHNIYRQILNCTPSVDIIGRIGLGGGHGEIWLTYVGTSLKYF